jgi:hypothetical protein
MRANPSPMSVADYCQAYNSGKIKVNEDYQRKVGLWTSQARSYFIESILLEYPIPKIYLHARLDLKSRQQIKEVVDGQQRTQALVMFYNNKQKLTNNIDTISLRGLKYSQLDDDWKSKFLSYSLPIDQFSGAPDDEIREAFRRMNANNVPLNDEEQRNARYQGPFKWFVVKIADKYQNQLASVGLFSRRDLIRMADLKMYSEIILAIDDGFSTVKGKQIDDLYKKYNASFAREEEFEGRLSSAIDGFLTKRELHQASFLRAHVFQSIALAILAGRDADLANRLIGEGHREQFQRISEAAISLEILAQSLREPQDFPELQDFIDACSKKTNVEESKRVRFMYFFIGLGLLE